ncbi:conserved hypothetical protein [Vibrio nigripulchritudo SO65]|uniref:hypothetical protein n=1 Tax=Vibrio nigripulchritudo TaxID=28173 RepID=UPI0003B22EA9|nr:hypothetical protein [Vibrio nigripulchritudo]CCN34030.1 conserved hypothetical protein [Vibrio nigripulchritudo AM115]CCN39988.1 conserved hypothetical protein [Vibrio nigripulchritudo FTn2]CCN68003.1 conserved hypothetical protein [Vibrio nigripulchritudo POn4]CCN76611.1 conserved hypothetical protein [Vibrio nigripulchritudo SO65]
MASQLGKGFEMEEHLRNYFNQAGYYVVRGVPFNYEGFDVTDIDLWLYSRASSTARNITIVDVKNKKTPQAIERIFWVKGLAEAVSADDAIVATTDRREAVKDFGKQLGVLVLDGVFLSKLSNQTTLSQRLSDEEFISNIELYSLGKLDGDWKGQIIASKALLSDGLNFDTCNKWLQVAEFFAQQAIVHTTHSETAYRCFTYVLSLFSIGVDYIMRELSFLEQNERKDKLAEGFTYGSMGKEGIAQMINMSLSLVEQFSEEGKGVAKQIKRKVDNEFAALPSTVLAEFLSSNTHTTSLFSIAKELELCATSKESTEYSTLSIQVKSLIGCLLDYWSIDRKTFASALYHE